MAALRRRGGDLLETFAWQDLWQGEQAKSFTVAKSVGFDILGDIHGSLTEALAGGETFETWSKRLRPILADKGWWGRKEVLDPATGTMVEAQLGSPRRLRTIYDTNMRTSHAAGRWARIERTAETQPFLRYMAVLDERTREPHRRWHGTVLRWDHPWWDTHAPPNGWGCRCTIQQLGPRDLERLGYEVSPQAPDAEARPREWTNPRTGATVTVPPGIDPGWGYNPGRAGAPVTHALGTLAGMPPELAGMAYRANPGLAGQAAGEFGAWLDGIAAARTKPRGDVRPVGVLDRGVVERLTALGHPPASAAVSISDRQVAHALRDTKTAARTADDLPKALSLPDLRRLPEIIARPEAVYWDSRTSAVLYIVPSETARHGKVVVRLNYATKDASRRTVVTNMVLTTGYESREALLAARFVRLDDDGGGE